MSAELTADAEGHALVAAIHHRKAIADADAAYTAAVVAAVGGSGTWGDVQQAGLVAKQVKGMRA